MKKLFSQSLFSFLFLLLAAQHSRAAACCGGGFAVPSLITGDERASLTSSFSYSVVDTDVFASGIWQKRTEQDTSQIIRLEGAHIFNDRYQAGFSLPIQNRKKSGTQGGDSSGIADFSAQLGYEYLPDWDYNIWRPRGVGFVSLTLPTGKSIYESDTLSAVDSRGRGFWAFGVGTALTKSWAAWDASTIFEAHKSFDKNLDSAQVSGTLKPGYGASLSIGSGYNTKDFRFGTSIMWVYEDAVRFEGSVASPGAIQRYATGVASLSQMLSENWAWTLSYQDQTIFGSPTNATLARTAMLALQKRWDR